MPKNGQIRVGISGWTYQGWRGTFYPPSLPHRAEMAYAASRFHTIEINGTFYSLQRASSFRSWYEHCADDFVFAVKGSRYITHMKQLNDPAQPLANFFAQGILELGSKLGVILWQFSPRFRFQPEKLEAFLAMLPRTHADAAAIATDHDGRVKDPSVAARTPNHRIRYAVEVRHESFLVPEFVELLRNYGAALVVAGTAGAYPLIEESTADFMYLRLHGTERMYAGSYPDRELDRWADRVRHWAKARQDVFVYFDNDEKTKAPFDARRLMEKLGVAGDLPAPVMAASPTG